MDRLAVYLDAGPKWTFACALDWPGWARRARGDEAAIEELLSYASRYSAAVGVDVQADEVDVVGRLDGGKMIDFGAISQPGPWDDRPWEPGEAQRQVGLLEAAWRSFDAVAAAAPAELAKGPKGGGRDTAKMIHHVQEAERSYASKVGAPTPPRTPWADQRAAITAALLDSDRQTRWPPRYSIRRLAWHVLDHLWEIEDKS